MLVRNDQQPAAIRSRQGKKAEGDETGKEYKRLGPPSGSAGRRDAANLPGQPCGRRVTSTSKKRWSGQSCWLLRLRVVPLS